MLKQLIADRLGIGASNQHLYHRSQELQNNECIGVSKRTNRKKAPTPVTLQLLVGSTVNVRAGDIVVGLWTSDACTVGQMKEKVCAWLGYDTVDYAVFVGLKRTNDKAKIGDCRLLNGEELRFEKRSLSVCGQPIVWLRKRMARWGNTSSVQPVAAAIAAANAYSSPANIGQLVTAR
ncbi:hypothetical protein LPJ66_000690 [Kickxella alabastrina]|uniref:Uncharacterized protein n=1 Tax=Kickxella alabastrina TaxID=61397 RepID=A0ACC1IVE6_9FUNG|nr:hypothetical protein LPJ66_000690 [Kickxella alabastrina]